MFKFGCGMGHLLCLSLVSSFLSPNTAVLVILWQLQLTAVPACSNAMLLLWGNKLVISY